MSRDSNIFPSDPLTQSKAKRSHDTPQSLASLSSRSSLSSLSPPGSPMDTPYHSAPQDCPLTQMTEEYMEQAGRGLLEELRAQSHSHSHAAMLGSEDALGSTAAHQVDNKSHSPAQTSFTSTGTRAHSECCTVNNDHCTGVTGSVCSSLGVTLRGNSVNRSGRRTRRVSAGVSEDALATDSGVFEAWGKRYEKKNTRPTAPPSVRGENCNNLNRKLLCKLSENSVPSVVIKIVNGIRSVCRCVFLSFHITIKLSIISKV